MEEGNRVDLGVKSLAFTFFARDGEGLAHSFMMSIFGRGLGWLICTLLMFAFGAMLVVGTIGLVKGKAVNKTAATTTEEVAGGGDGAL